MSDKIYHCVSCGYTGHETGYKLGHGIDAGHACKNECKFDDGSKHEGQYIEMLYYEPEADMLPDASAFDHDKALAAVHEFKRKNKPMSEIGSLAFGIGVLAMMQQSIVPQKLEV